jgi:alpha-D-ribose 1-methylphosphonate 5-triphosphate synthase subunit PhnG
VEPDQILCECSLEELQAFVRLQEEGSQVQLVRHPVIATTMVRAEDSVEGQPFYLGEALITECELSVDGQLGYGICLGDEPVRSYCIAFVDALLLLKDHRLAPLQDFLGRQDEIIRRRQAEEQDHINRTRVDFKLVEEE